MHELLANRTDFLGQGGTEHHHLFLMGGLAENGLDIMSHVQFLQHFVTFIQHKVCDLLKVEGAVADQGHDATGSADHDVGGGFQRLHVGGKRLTTVKHLCAKTIHVLCKADVLVTNLVCEFVCVAKHQNPDTFVFFLDVFVVQHVKGRQHKNSSFSHARLGLTENIGTESSLGDALLLNF
eukprot:Lithocolla_globosa_v1_NODE_2349_length_2039_cov_131.369456.p2 type:complete len:180 gc:universal NODE_2349_length_2039_cov_131.369456:640-1179(+)